MLTRSGKILHRSGYSISVPIRYIGYLRLAFGSSESRKLQMEDGGLEEAFHRL